MEDTRTSLLVGKQVSNCCSTPAQCQQPLLCRDCLGTGRGLPPRVLHVPARVASRLNRRAELWSHQDTQRWLGGQRPSAAQDTTAVARQVKTRIYSLLQQLRRTSPRSSSRRTRGRRDRPQRPQPLMMPGLQRTTTPSWQLPRQPAVGGPAFQGRGASAGHGSAGWCAKGPARCSCGHAKCRRKLRQHLLGDAWMFAYLLSTRSTRFCYVRLLLTRVIVSTGELANSS